MPELGQELPRPQDGPGHDRGEKGHEKQDIEKGTRRLVGIAVVIDGVGQALKGVEGEPHRKEHIRTRQSVGDKPHAETAEARQRFQPEHKEFVIFEEREEADVRGHVRYDEGLAYAGALPETGEQVRRPPVEHGHRQQERHEGDPGYGIKKEVAQKQKGPVRLVAVAQQPARHQDKQQKGRELQRNKIHRCLSGQKVLSGKNTVRAR